MGKLSDDLYNMGFTPTGRQSPVHDDGELWSNGHEVVCDETGTVIDGNHAQQSEEIEDEIFRYRNSNRVKLPGGFISNYDY